jgi:trimethyllysine dioxygenase
MHSSKLFLAAPKCTILNNNAPRVLCPAFAVPGRSLATAAEAVEKTTEKIPSWPTRNSGNVYDEKPTVQWHGSGPVVLSWPNKHAVKLGSLYLRDHCSCKECRHEETKQRLLDTFAIPKDITAKEVSATTGGLSVQWANDSHHSFYTWDWLRRQSLPSTPPNSLGRTIWSPDLLANPPSADYNAIMTSPAGVAKWTSLIHRFGFSYVDGVPPTPEATQSLLERISFIRHTHYGGFWDFTSDLAAADTAYTDLALGAHTDTTYFTDPAGLQMFHLLSHTEGKGGASLLVDGFAAAERLRDESPEAFRVLSTMKIRSHASGGGINVMPAERFPVIRLDSAGELMQIRWNNDDRATFSAAEYSAEEIEGWYDAARKWVGIIRRPEFEYWEQLVPGRPVIFDNWRVLHGRSAFTGKRRMCGGYINMDDFRSRLNVLHWGHEEAVASVI